MLRKLSLALAAALALGAIAQADVSVYHEPPHPSPPPAAPANRAQVAPAAKPSDGTAADLARIQAEQQKAWGSVNQLNPFSADGKGLAPGGADTPAGPFDQFAKLLSNPMVQGYLKLFSNPTFSRGADQLVAAFKGPKRMTMLYAEAGFILFMLILRAWRFSMATHWIKRLWTQAWTFVLFWVGMLVVIPWAVLGDPYYNTVAGVLDVLLTSLKQR